jgi:hypothetical protein
LVGLKNSSTQIDRVLCDPAETKVPTVTLISTPTVNSNRGIYMFISNMCPAGSSLWPVKLEDVTRNFSFTYDVPAGGGQALHLDPGKYLITDWTEDGSFSRGPIELVGLETSAFDYRLRLCDPDATPTQNPQDTAPGTYYFANNCVGEPYGRAKDGVYWTFTLLESFTGDTASVGSTIEIFIPLGESRSGEIPAGLYHIKHWFVGDSSVYEDYEDGIDGGKRMIVNFCPDMPLLPGAPTQ